MEARILEIVEALLDPQGATTQKMAAITEEAKNLAMSPEFYSAGMSILSNPEISQKVRDGCAVLFTERVTNNIKRFPEELRGTVVRTLPTLLAQCLTSPSVLSSFEKLANVVCANVFNFAAGEVTEEMNFLINATRDFMGQGQFKAGLLLAKSVFRAIKNPKNGAMQWFHEGFSNAFVPVMAEHLSHFSDLWEKAAAFHCVSRMLLNALPQCFGQCGVFFLDSSLSDLPQLIEKSDQDARRCATEMLKFLLKSVEALRKVDAVNDQMTNNLLGIVHLVITKDTTERHVALAVGILFALVVECGFYDIVNSNLVLIIEMLASVFSISRADVENFQLDPPAFVVQVHGTSPEWEDKRASAGRFLVKVAKKTEIAAALVQYVGTAIQAFQANQDSVQAQFNVFSACQMLSVVANRVPDFYAFFNSLTFMLQSPSPVIKSAGFLLLTDLKRIEFNADLLQAAFKCASEEGVVSYYAALVFSKMLENHDQKDAIKAIIAPYFSSIYDLFSKLTNEFHDDRLTMAFSNIAVFFDDEVVPHGADIFKDMLVMFVQAAQDPNPQSNFVLMTSDSMMVIISVIARHPDVSPQIFSAIYPLLCQAIVELGDSEFTEEVLKVVTEVIFRSSVFDPAFWSVLEAIGQNSSLDLDSVSTIIEQLIYKDQELGSRGEIVNNLCGMIMQGFNDESDDVIAPATIATSLVMRLGAQTPILNNLLQVIGTYMTSKVCSEVVSLFCAVLIQCPSLLTEQSDLVNGVFQTWIEVHPYPLFIPAAVKSVPAFASTPDAAKALIAAGLQSVEDGKEDDMDFGDDDDDDDDAKFQAAPSDVTGSVIPNPTWFTDTEMQAFIAQLTEWAK